jgi:hypothetical protein
VYIYTKYFNGRLGYLLRDKNPQTIQEAQELAKKIEGNLHSSNIDPFSNPRRKIDIEPNIVHDVEPSSDICTSLANLETTMDGMMKNQELMMNRIVNLERAQSQAPRVPYKGQFQKGNQIYKPKDDQEVSNTLSPTNIVDENPWCLQCSEAHREHEFPYNNGGHDQVNNVGHIIEGP